MDPNNQPFQPTVPPQDPNAGASPPQGLSPVDQNTPLGAPQNDPYAMPPAPELMPQQQPAAPIGQSLPSEPVQQMPPAPGLPGDPSLAMPQAVAEPPTPGSPANDLSNPTGPAPMAPGISPTDPNLNNGGMAVPPAMAGNPDMAASSGNSGGRKALGFMFVIGGVIALIAIIVIAIRTL